MLAKIKSAIKTNIKINGKSTKNHETFLYPLAHNLLSKNVQIKTYIILKTKNKTL